MHSWLRWLRWTLALALTIGAGARAMPLYTVVGLGFEDSEHTRADGWRESEAWRLTESGKVAGYATRYSGTMVELGQSVWLYEGASIVRLGMTDELHRRNDDRMRAWLLGLNEAGQVIGASERYGGGASLGTTAWLYDGGTTIPLGFTDAEHTSSTGVRRSWADYLNGSGLVAGHSDRFQGGSSSGRSAWLYDGQALVALGLTGGEYTRSDGYRSSEVGGLNEAGQLVGISSRFDGTASLGSSAWLYTQGTTLAIGPTGTEHTRADGFREISPWILTPSGQVFGTAVRFAGESTSLGQSVWVFDGSETGTIGMVDALHTRSDGYRWSELGWSGEIPQDDVPAGPVAGHSTRFAGSASNGQTAWVYDAGATTPVGLGDPEHIGSGGLAYSAIEALHRAGHAIGNSRRYLGTDTWHGDSAWIYRDGSTLRIGLVDSEHTGSDGWQASYVRGVNEAGQVIGYSARFDDPAVGWGRSAWLYDGVTTRRIGPATAEETPFEGILLSHPEAINEAGQVIGSTWHWDGDETKEEFARTAWFYDAASDITFVAPAFSLSASGDAFSRLTFLRDDGLALGSYTWFDGPDVAETRALAFRMDLGWLDLASLVDGDLSEEGLRQLAWVYDVNASGQILGQGLRWGHPDAGLAFLLSPVTVPEPGTLWLSLAGFALAGLGRMSKRGIGATAPESEATAGKR